MTDYTPILTDAQIGAIVCEVYKKTGAAEIGELRLKQDAVALGRAVERAAIEAHQRQQWRPIETAPHETLVVLGWYEGDVFKQEIALASAGRRYPGGVSDMWWHGRATHWMPLPSPPEAL